jgi:ubiquinone/menaquinone biosynthesis C-methylase UbiE
MALHPLAQQFASVADAYERGRPEYSPAAVGALASELGISPGARVLDLAAGTGKLSRALLAGGFDLVAVEPLAALREVLGERIGPERVLDGVAEAIPLADASVAAVTVADAFHWFDPVPALLEIRRVLCPGGALAVVKTAIDWSGASWSHEVGTIVFQLRPEHPQFESSPWQDALPAAGGWTAPRELRITTSQPADPERILDHISSMSWIAAMPEDLRAETIERMRELVLAGQTPAELPLHVLITVTAPVVSATARAATT